jgi:hypothetical protein
MMHRMQAPSGLEAVTDAKAAFTLLDLLGADDPDGIRVRSLVPGDHEAYVRILHPAWEDRLRERRIPWKRIAETTGARLEGTVAFRRITVPPGSEIPKGPQGAWDEDATPEEGTLPRDEARVLFSVLPPAGRCWFLVWEGWDGLRLAPDQVTVPLFGNPHLVYRGPSEVLWHFDWTLWGRWQLPHMWLPEDRTWCVGTYLESFDTYVGGSAGLVERVAAAPGLETIRVDPDDLAVILGEWLIT